MRYAGIIIFIFIIILPIASKGNIISETAEILETVDKFIEALETGDTKLAKEILVPEGSNFSVREEENSFRIKHTNYKTLINSLPATKGKYKEIIGNPEILLHKNIAVVWVDYKFYIDKKFSHCGVDSFSLIKSEGKWKIVSIIYTVEKKGCK